MTSQQCNGICSRQIFIEQYRVKGRGKGSGLPNYIDYIRCTKCGYLVPKDTIGRCNCCGNKFKRTTQSNYAIRKTKLREKLGISGH